MSSEDLQLIPKDSAKLDMNTSAAGESSVNEQQSTDLHLEQRQLLDRTSNSPDSNKSSSSKNTEYSEIDPSDARIKNFPPLPKWCPCQPCFHVNISDEVPLRAQWKIFSLIALLFTYTLLLFVNFTLSFGGLVVGINSFQDSAPFVITVIMATVWLFVLPLLSLFAWFVPVYTAYRKNSSLMFMWWFFVTLMQCIVWFVFALGAPGTSCGIIMGSQLLKYSNAIGALYLALGIGWIAMLIWGGVLLVLVHKDYRLSGGTINSALGEASSKASSSKLVQDTIKHTVKKQTV